MEKLVVEAKNGNTEALEKLINKVYDKLYKIAVIKLKDKDDAQDIVQNTMELICKNIGNLRENKYFEAWAIRILINECNRKFNSTSEKIENLENEDTIFSEFNIEYINDRLDIQDILNILDNRDREIIILYLNGYSIKEIADIMQMNENTVKTRIKRAKEKIKKNYKVDKENGGITKISKTLITILVIILVTTGLVYASIKFINNYHTEEKAEPIKWSRYTITMDASQDAIEQCMDKYDENVYILSVKDAQTFYDIKDKLNITFNDEDIDFLGEINTDTFEKFDYEVLFIVINQQPMFVHEVLPYSDRLEIGFNFKENSSKGKVKNAFCIVIPKAYHKDNIILKYEKRPDLTEVPKDATFFSSSKFYINNIEEFDKLDLKYDNKQDIYYFDKLLQQNDYENLVQQLGIVTENEMTEERLKNRNIIIVFQKSDNNMFRFKRVSQQGDIPTLYFNRLEGEYGRGINGIVFTFTGETYNQFNINVQ